MLHLIAGKIGGGKSLYALRQIVWELRHTTRTVVTNMSIKVDELAAYMHSKYDVGGIQQRIRLLSDEQSAHFWRHRGWLSDEGRWFDLLYEPKPGQNLVLQASEDELKRSPGACLYVIDEAHLLFNSREWAKNGNKAIWYLSQHRKMGDDVIAVTQFPDNLDKQFRVLAQDVTMIRNLSNETRWGFRGPRRFIQETFPQWPIGPNTSAMTHGTFLLDVDGLAACYDTSAGVGITGRMDADKRAKRKGLPWWALPIPALGIAVLLFLLISSPMRMIPKFAGSFAATPKPAPAPAAPAPQGAPSAAAMRETFLSLLSSNLHAIRQDKWMNATDAGLPRELYIDWFANGRAHTTNGTYLTVAYWDKAAGWGVDAASGKILRFAKAEPSGTPPPAAAASWGVPHVPARYIIGVGSSSTN